MSKYVCLRCGEIYENKSTTKIKINKKNDWAFCPKMSCHGKIVELDDNMVAPVLMLNQHKVETEFCCGGHIGDVIFDPYITIKCSDNNGLGELVRNSLLKYTYCSKFWYIEEFVKPIYPDYYLNAFFRDNLVHLSHTNKDENLIIRGTPAITCLYGMNEEDKDFFHLISLNYKIAKQIILYSHESNTLENKNKKKELLAFYNFNIQRFRRLEEKVNENFFKLSLANQQLLINDINSEFISIVKQLCADIDFKLIEKELNGNVNDENRGNDKTGWNNWGKKECHFNEFGEFKEELNEEDIEFMKEQISKAKQTNKN